jgi:hypothetical protein
MSCCSARDRYGQVGKRGTLRLRKAGDASRYAFQPGAVVRRECFERLTERRPIEHERIGGPTFAKLLGERSKGCLAPIADTIDDLTGAAQRVGVELRCCARPALPPSSGGTGSCRLLRRHRAPAHASGTPLELRGDAGE